MTEPLTAAERYIVQEGAAAADRESLLAIIDAYEATVVALEAERDAADAHRAEWQELAEEYRRIAQQRTAERDVAAQRATCLAALETAAREG